MGADAVVLVKPEARQPRALLDEILGPLGLEARDGPEGSILVVAADPASRTGTVRGRVLSAARGSPISRAFLRVPGTGARALSRRDRTFELSGVPVGSREVVAEAFGFVAGKAAGVEVRAGAPAELTFRLAARPTYVDRIVVTPSRRLLVQQEQAARLTVGSEDAVLVPSLGGDVSRVVELLPSVAAPDNSAAFNVRGSAPREVSVVLDGLEIYEPFHLPQLHSPFSLIDGKIVERIDVLAGGYTADLGDRHGGFAEVSTETPEDSRRTRVELGTVNSRISYQASTRLGSLLVSARGWYPEAIRRSTEFGENGLRPAFGDAYVKGIFGVSSRALVSAHGLVAYDRLDFAERDGNETVRSASRSGHLWVRGSASWSPSLFSQSVVSAGRLERSREGISEPEDEAVLVDDQRDVTFFGLSHDLTWDVSSAHVLRAGASIRHLSSAYRYSSSSAGGTGSTRTLRLGPSGTSLAAYLAYRASPSPRFAVEIGLRWDRQTYVGEEQMSPRFNAIWRPGVRSEVRLGAGRFFQSQRIHELRVEDGETTFLPAELSRQREVTFQHAFAGGLRLRLDAYDRTLSRLHPRYENLHDPLELFPETEADRVLVSPQGARLRGLEVLVRSDPAKRFIWWVGYARSAAEERIGGRTVPRSWDQNHAGRFLLSHRWGERWLVSLSGVAHTGWPITPVSATLVALPDGSTAVESEPGPRNSERFPAYARLDVKVARSLFLPKGRLVLDLQVTNLTNRRNACCVDEFLFEPRPDGTVEVRRELSYWLGIVPTFSATWEF